jgi:hypothetical protein
MGSITCVSRRGGDDLSSGRCHERTHHNRVRLGHGLTTTGCTHPRRVYACLDQIGVSTLEPCDLHLATITSMVCRHLSRVVRSMASMFHRLLLSAFENRRHPLTAAHTHGLQPVAGVTALHFVQ